MKSFFIWLLYLMFKNPCFFTWPFESSLVLSRFRSGGRNCGRTFGIAVGRSKFRPGVRKNENENCDKRSENGLPEIFVEGNWPFEYEY